VKKIPPSVGPAGKGLVLTIAAYCADESLWLPPLDTTFPQSTLRGINSAPRLRLGRGHQLGVANHAGVMRLSVAPGPCNLHT